MSELLRFTSRTSIGGSFSAKKEFAFFDDYFEIYDKKGKLIKLINYNDIIDYAVVKTWQNNIIINIKPMGFNIYNVSEENCNKFKEIIENFKKDDTQLSIIDKWKIDIEQYSNPNYKVDNFESQCYKCAFADINNVFKCPKIGDIPRDIKYWKAKCKYRRIKFNIEPMDGANQLDFGDSREFIQSQLRYEVKKNQDTNNLMDEYDFYCIYYDENGLFEAIKIFYGDLDIYYENVALPREYSQILKFFKEKYNDIEEMEDGFMSKMGSLRVFVKKVMIQ